MSHSSQHSPAKKNIKAPSMLDALLPVLFLMSSVAGSVYLFGLSAMDGPLQVGILLSTMIATLIVLKNGHPWEAVSKSTQHGVGTVIGAIFILLAVGALIGTWNMSGTIPTLVYYGIQLISPDWFYPVTFIVCMITSLSIGSSWTTAGTVGVGLVGLATMIGVSPEITAGAVISGAYVGDKISPLSETTVLAAQLNEVDLYEHIRYQSQTTLLAGGFALVSFVVLGWISDSPVFDSTMIQDELSKFDQLFNISLWNLVPLVVLLFLSIKKVPPALAIIAAALVAGIMAVFFQGEAVARFIQRQDIDPVLASLKGVWSAMASGFQANSGIPHMDALLSRGGMSRMLNTIWLIIVAVTFGTVIDEFGLLSKLVQPILIRAKTAARLVGSVVGTALGLNIITGDQYIALLLPSRLYKKEFDARGIPAKNLSRMLGDAGIVTSPLVPWNSCGAYMAAVLGVTTWQYLPYAIFNVLSPIVTLVIGIYVCSRYVQPPVKS